MDKQNLRKFVGKKLIWWGQDEENGRTYLFFDDMAAIAAESIVEIDDGVDLAARILSERYEGAKHILELDRLLTKHVDKVEGAEECEPQSGLSVETFGGSVTLTNTDSENG
ncbi:MAG: hypothetical protein EBU84_15165 [Actinobacteria bacterium]|nr:hypothetical protein [Actinomycetota bacterium]